MTKHDIVIFLIHDHMHRQRPDFAVLWHRTRSRPRSGDETARNSTVRIGDDARRPRGAGEEGRQGPRPSAILAPELLIAAGAGMATTRSMPWTLTSSLAVSSGRSKRPSTVPEHVMDAASWALPRADQYRPQHVRRVGHAGDGRVAAANRAEVEGPPRQAGPCIGCRSRHEAMSEHDKHLARRRTKISDGV